MNAPPPPTYNNWLGWSVYITILSVITPPVPTNGTRVAVKLLPIRLPARILPVAVMLPVTLKLVPVAAPMLGVVKLADALTEIFPPPSNAVVVPSTLALITVPAKLTPAAVLAVYVWLELN